MFTCDVGVPTENVSDAREFVGLWYGYYSAEQDADSVTAGCFNAGRDHGIAEMAGAIIETIDGSEGGY